MQYSRRKNRGEEVDENIKDTAAVNEEKKGVPEGKPVEETVEKVADEIAEETVVDVKETNEDAEKKPVKGKKGSRRGGGNNKALELELEKQKAITEEVNDRYKRLLAEFENARNRNEKESKHMYDVGAKEVLEKLLPVVDNFERALMAIPEEDKERAFEQGVDKIYKQMMVTLEEIGVTPMNAEGTEFNPDFHNAVLHVEDEELGENVVAEELQKGYMYKEEVLRHSMVKVAN
ncbi:MAG: nucleotide exchange factor GrpE [Lachnospiraceae bacterium]|jgi:molecular chaperone GrpE|nr:nucleotide exchange factor GrpE [Lachnospiraceae bacterium]